MNYQSDAMSTNLFFSVIIVQMTRRTEVKPIDSFEDLVRSNVYNVVQAESYVNEFLLGTVHYPEMKERIITQPFGNMRILNLFTFWKVTGSKSL